MASSDPTWCYPDLLQILTTLLLLGAELIITHEPARCQHLYTDAHVRTMNDPLGKRSDRGVKHRSDTRWPQPSWACDINTTRRSSDRRKSEKKGSKIPSMYFSDKKSKNKTDIILPSSSKPDSNFREASSKCGCKRFPARIKVSRNSFFCQN